MEYTFFYHLLLLLKKNWLIKSRNLNVFLFEIVLMNYILVSPYRSEFNIFTYLFINRTTGSSKTIVKFFLLFRHVLEARDINSMGDMMNHLKYMDMYVGIIGEKSKRDLFKNKMDNVYPGFHFEKNKLTDEEKSKYGDIIDILNVPKLSERCIEFDDENGFNDYILDDNYVNKERVFLSVTLNKYEGNSIDYMIRYNESDVGSTLLSSDL